MFKDSSIFERTKMKKKNLQQVYGYIYASMYNITVYTRFFALDKDWDFISVNLHRHSNIQGMYNLFFF